MRIVDFTMLGSTYNFFCKYLWGLFWDIINLEFECSGSLWFYDFLGVSRRVICIGHFIPDFWKLSRVFYPISYKLLSLSGLAGGNR